MKSNISYRFDSLEYEELKETYKLDDFVGLSDFETCKNVLDWVNKNVIHAGNYDGSDRQDALTLLKRAYPKQKGINCVKYRFVLSVIGYGIVRILKGPLYRQVRK